MPVLDADVINNGTNRAARIIRYVSPSLDPTRWRQLKIKGFDGSQFLPEADPFPASDFQFFFETWLKGCEGKNFVLIILMYINSVFRRRNLIVARNDKRWPFVERSSVGEVWFGDIGEIRLLWNRVLSYFGHRENNLHRCVWNRLEKFANVRYSQSAKLCARYRNLTPTGSVSRVMSSSIF